MIRELLFFLIVFIASTTIIFGQYEIIEIETGIGLTHINNNLEAAGYGGNFPNYNLYHWNNGNLTMLSVPPQPFTAFELNAINDSGFIVGSINFDDDTLGYLFAKWDRTGSLVFMDNNIYESFGNDINNNNIVAGSQLFCNNENCPEYAVVFSINNTPTNITPNGFAYGINNLNYVVGRSFENGFDPFFWNGNALTYLPEPPGANHGTYAIKINDNNYIIGRSQIGNNSIPVYWINQQLIVPQMPAGLEYAEFIDINSSNQILGDGGLPLGGFIFEEGDVKLINDLIPQNSGWEILSVQDINDKGVILAQGRKNGIHKQIFLIPSFVKSPSPYEKWIAGETDTIKWTETSWLAVNIKCITNIGTPIESEIILTTGDPIADSKFIWEIPDTILSFRTKIVIENANDTSENLESDIFRIKPYVLTRLREDSTYYEYRKDRDQWGFSNTEADMWPQTWYNQFNYSGIDPFTGINNLQYSQTQGDSVFAKIAPTPYAHMDWISWVNTFGVDACYFSALNGMYKPTALIKWWANLDVWNGSCFGIAAANSLAFSNREQFQNKYPTYPNFINPITVVSDTGVKRVVNELYTHQYGNPSKANDVTGLIKTPNQSLNDIKQMLIENTSIVKTLSIFNNGGSGGHTILAYGLKQDAVQENLYYIQVYDNSNPTSVNPITIDTLTNAGNGSWNTPDWVGWGGNGKIYLEIISDQYFNGASFPKQSNRHSSFILPENVLEINNSRTSQIRIIDGAGNVSGYVNGFVFNEIPDAWPLIVKNGSESPPYGYSLPVNNYSVVLNEFTKDTVSAFFFTSNKSFMYERNSSEQNQTDRLFFDGGVSVANADAETKTVRLLNLINETTQEKLCVVRAVELAQNDSVKIENPDSNKVKIISYGSAKNYDVELNYVTENGLGRFCDFNIPLSANTSHTFVPDWANVTNTNLMVLVDVGNDGTIDDTLLLINQVTVVGDGQGLLLSPKSYSLAQNYPNPFNPITTIKYSIAKHSNVTIRVYDILGNVVQVLVNEERERGVYSINFDAFGLASGIYFYKLQAGSFVETKKMIILK